MKKRKNIKACHRGHSGKIAIMILVLGLILLAVSCKPPATEEPAPGADGYPPPQNLSIAGFTGSGEDRAVNLGWEAPDTGLTVTHYVVYRNGEELAETADTEYQDVIGNSDYDFYVTAIYEDDIESSPTNTINTGDPADMPPVGPGDAGKDRENDEDSDLNGDDDKDTDAQAFNWDEVLSGPCGNPYYPVAVGISHTYATSTGTITSTITDISEDGFTVTHTVASSTQTHEWECLPEGLVDLSNPIGDAFETMVEGVTLTGDTSVTGVTIPASISVGDKWTQTYLGTMNVQEYDGALDFSLTVNYSVVGEEEVTVPAGTFKALKLNNTLESDFILKTSGISMPLYNYSATGTSWVVENIGTVKSITQGMIKGLGYMEGQLSHEFSDTMELIEFSLP